MKQRNYTPLYPIVDVEVETKDKLLDGTYKVLVVRGSISERVLKYMLDDSLEIRSDEDEASFAMCSIDGYEEGSPEVMYSLFNSRLGPRDEFFAQFGEEEVLTVFSLYELHTINDGDSVKIELYDENEIAEDIYD